ncbi:MAG: hypothetical protein QW303_00505 [Nitrososphaerota archaeon]
MLCIPQELKADLIGDCLRLNSRFYGCTLKKLFQMPENLRFLTNQIYKLITNPEFIGRHITTNYSTEQLLELFLGKKKILKKNMWDFVSSFQHPHCEDLDINNTIYQLHQINKRFIYETAISIIASPFLLDSPGCKNFENSKAEWDYDESSWIDGWHPEHLFTNSSRNRKAGYWFPWSGLPGTYFDSNPEAQGLGHRYNRKVYHENEFNQFPRWQDLRRQVERDINESLREGGISDRRVLRPSGYNMSSLRNKSTY